MLQKLTFILLQLRSTALNTFMYVCVSVCLSARNNALYLYPIFCMLPIAVARSSLGVVAIRYVLPVLWMTSYFLSIIKLTYLPHSRTEFDFLLLKGIILTIPNYSQTEVKGELRNLTINGKNYRNARRHSYCYYGNDERLWRNKYTLMHERRKPKLV